MEFIAPETEKELFQASLRNAVGNQMLVSSAQAGSVICTSEALDQGSLITVFYSDLPRGMSAVVYITAVDDTGILQNIYKHILALY